MKNRLAAEMVTRDVIPAVLVIIFYLAVLMATYAACGAGSAFYSIVVLAAVWRITVKASMLHKTMCKLHSITAGRTSIAHLFATVATRNKKMDWREDNAPAR